MDVPGTIVDGRRRVVIEAIRPQVDAGRFPVKRVVGDTVHVEADVFADGHDVVVARLLHRPAGTERWSEVEMSGPDNDRWRAAFPVEQVGRHEYTIEGWIDRLATWQRDMERRIEAEQDLAVDLRIGANLVGQVAERARAARALGDAAQLRAWAAELVAPLPAGAAGACGSVALDPARSAIAARHPDRSLATRWEPPFEIVVDRERARFSAWYELFPRSTSPDPARHGTLRDVIARLPYVADLGFDVLYLPPIHPIGHAFRKGPNNSVAATPTDPGSPWAIGSADGGHTAVNPELGTLDDVRALVAAAREHGLELAVDIAFQAAPDHPAVRSHPDWFRFRPDGTIQYAENPPKKYQDIVPFDFESVAWPALWHELRGVVEFWIAQGVTIFRVDNPHTKPFAFWEWLITTIKAGHPDVIFLAEAFTRPKVMYRLAKLGFGQSYTYFTWRNQKQEIVDYLTELTQTDASEFYRPNFWPNTPDILHDVLQRGTRATFEARLALAATLGANYGIYGPAFELRESAAHEPGSEEYLESEKYQQRTWDLEQPDSLAGFIRTINRIRREHDAFQSNASLRFHRIESDHLIAYTKRSADGAEAILTIVNLDGEQSHGGFLELALDAIGIGWDEPYEATDLVEDAAARAESRQGRGATAADDRPAAEDRPAGAEDRPAAPAETWRGARRWVEIDPARCAVQIYRLRPPVEQSEWRPGTESGRGTPPGPAGTVPEPTPRAAAQ
ncbi:MAG TPA: maltotransferase domain-containing protein [Candidatus Saccharimonadales bacterium]|nr:maltotransferase domain-containing protein [Candidatus Saccharimonadales bacterium]